MGRARILVERHCHCLFSFTVFFHPNTHFLFKVAAIWWCHIKTKVLFACVFARMCLHMCAELIQKLKQTSEGKSKRLYCICSTCCVNSHADLITHPYLQFKMNFMSSTNTNEKQILFFKTCLTVRPGGCGKDLLQVMDTAGCKSPWGSYLASNYPVCILPVFSAANVHENKRQQKAAQWERGGEEGRRAGKEETKGEKEMVEGGEWPLIPVQMMWGEDRERLASNSCRGSEEGFWRGGEGVGQLRDNNADWSTAARRRKRGAKWSVCVKSVMLLQLRPPHTSHTRRPHPLSKRAVGATFCSCRVWSWAVPCRARTEFQAGATCFQEKRAHVRTFKCRESWPLSLERNRIQPGCQNPDQRMTPEVEPERDEVVGGERATAVCPCPAAHPSPSSWPCRSYRSSRSWCRRPDAGPGSEVCVAIKQTSLSVIVFHDWG